MKISTLLVWTGVTLVLSPSAFAAPCSEVRDLSAALECVRKNEPSFLAAAQSAQEADELKSSAYRLINPELELEFLDANNLGSVDREETASLLFTFELGGKRSARAKVLEAQGMGLRADAFEQQIKALSEIGGALLRLNQVQAERRVLKESIEAFRRVIGLYRSRGSLSPEQRVSLHTFELVLLGYERKLIEADASLVRYQRRVEAFFGTNSNGMPLDIKKWSLNLTQFEKSFNQWIVSTPEMLRIDSETLSHEGALDVASAEVWPNLQIGPSISRNSQGPFEYTAYGFKASIPIPVLSWNGAERTSKRLTLERVRTRQDWNREDIRSKYQSLLSEMGRIRKLLEEIPGDEAIQGKHVSTESYYQRGMITGSLMIETHRALVEYYEAKHELQVEYLEGLLTLQNLERFISP